MKKALEYIESTKESIEATNKMVDLLQKRISLCEKRLTEEISEYDANELEILLLKTKSELITYKKVLEEKQKYFDKYSEKFKQEFSLVEEKFSALIERAKENCHKSKNLKEFLSSINMQEIERNPQAKIYAYKKIKDLLKSI